MPPLSLMIKPASGKCNLRCRYCFYHDVAENRETPDKGNMSLSLLETTLIKAFKYADGNQMLVNFQGGEPLLAGKGFMRAAINMINRLNGAGFLPKTDFSSDFRLTETKPQTKTASTRTAIRLSKKF